MGEMVSVPSNGGTSEGYLAVPSTPNGSAVIVIQEWWGLVGHIRDVADRLAALGYLTLAPDLYHGVKTTEPDEAGKLMMGLAMAEAGQDMAAAADYLAGRDEVSSGNVATVGFCMGGSLAMWAGTLSSHIVATVGFYPAVPWERMSPQWHNYTGKAALIHCSEEDGTSADPGIQQARSAIEAAGGETEVHDYPGTKHAFFNDDRPEVYDRAASAQAWSRTVDFLARRLG
ncbi:MAG TPA: dienelactone hydrolase family protein [Micromonosporaceae bacterium]